MSYVHEREIAAPPEAVRRVATDVFGSADSFTLHTNLRDGMAVEVAVEAAGDGSRVVLTGARAEPIPYFQWFVAFTLHRLSRAALAHAGERLAAEAEGRPAPRPPRQNLFAPPVAFDHDTASVIATVCAISLVAGLGSALFAGNANVIADAYEISDRTLSFGSAATRAGVLVGLVAAVVADRLGRRRALLWSVGGVCVASALSAVAPTFETFVVAQVLSRGLFNAVLVVGTIVAIEEAPERGRAYAVAMVTLAWGAGGAISTVLLPIGDLGTEAWRFSYVVNAAMLLALPGFARRLPESHRYSEIVARFLPRGRVGELFGPGYRRRLVLVLLVALLVNSLAASSSQLTNRFLGDERGFSQLEIALFLAVVAGVPGLVGLFFGGRIAETIGRRKVAIWGTLVGTAGTVVFFLTDGLSLWVLGTLDAFVAAATAPAMRALGPELFPTEVRGTANAALLIVGLAGSAAGLITTGLLSESWSLGTSIAVLGVGPALAALFVLPFLPEPAGKDLDVISPPVV